MTALVFCFDCQPISVHVVPDAYRMSRVLPPPFDIGASPRSYSVAWNAHSAFLAPEECDVPGYSRCSVGELLEGCDTTANIEILAAILSRYHLAYTQSGSSAGLAILIVPDSIPPARHTDISAAAFMAGFQSCLVLPRAHVLKSSFLGLREGQSGVALHSSQLDAHATLVHTDFECASISLSDVLSRSAICHRLESYVRRMFPSATPGAFIQEATNVLVDVWLGAEAASGTVWSDSREPLRISLDRETRRAIDQDLLAALESALASEVGTLKSVSFVYCTGPSASGISRIARLFFPDAHIECEADGLKIVRTAAAEARARQTPRIDSRLRICSTGPRSLAGSSSVQELVTTLNRGVAEFVDERLQLQSSSMKTLALESAGQPRVTLCELSVRPLDRGRGWAYFVVRVLTDDAHFFVCEVEFGRKGLLQMLVLDRTTGAIRRIAPGTVRRVRAE